VVSLSLKLMEIACRSGYIREISLPHYVKRKDPIQRNKPNIQHEKNKKPHSNHDKLGVQKNQ